MMWKVARGYVCEHVCIKHVGSGSNTRSSGQLGPPAQPPGPTLNGPHIPVSPRCPPLWANSHRGCCPPAPLRPIPPSIS